MDVVWIRGAGRVLDPGAGIDGAGDLWFRDGVVAGMGEPPSALRASARTIDAAGGLVTPMFVDLHVHLREPGAEEAETIASGTAAALAGGYRTVWAMPNTSPACDTPQAVRALLDRARAAGPCEVVPVSALSRGLAGKDLVDMGAMAAAGAGGFSDDGMWLADDALAERAFRWAARHDALVMQHCEDLALARAGVLHDAPAVRAAGLPPLAPEAEDRAVRRDLALAERLGTRLHVCHVSTRGAIGALRAARARGARVSGEATPHHLLLAVEDALAGGPDFKMKPPLRDREDARALLAALADGTIEAVATDHAPHPDARKACGLREAPFGSIGTETAFAALHTLAVGTGALPLERLVAALTSGPSRVAGRPAPSLAPGAAAAANVIDVAAPRRVDRAALRSRSHNCPFHGRALTGWVTASVIGREVRLP